MKKYAVISLIVAPIVLLVIGIGMLFAPTGSDATKDLVTIPVGMEEQEVIALLHEKNIVKNVLLFSSLLTITGRHNTIESGAYYLAKNMSLWDSMQKMTTAPDMKWVTIPEGLRKEEIGERLAKTFNWNDEKLRQWNTEDTTSKPEYVEGVYFPDTYLIPVDETGAQIAQRMINRFNEKVEPYMDEFAKQDIIWTTGIRFASVIQREAASKEDMPLIAGILWNRLLKKQKLEIDATVQYARGNTGSGWWAPISPKDIQTIDSPYNTYKYTGLPPQPISNPGIEAIDAVVHPTETECLFYIHDSNREIHCAKTYKEHQENIERYLK